VYGKELSASFLSNLVSTIAENAREWVGGGEDAESSGKGKEKTGCKRPDASRQESYPLSRVVEAGGG